jgi:hypothetical protein
LWRDPDSIEYVPFGAVVATCELVDCVPMVAVHADAQPERNILAITGSGRLVLAGPDRAWNWEVVSDQRPYGDFRPGRWAWLLADVRPVVPAIPARGRQGLWPWVDPR